MTRYTQGPCPGRAAHDARVEDRPTMPCGRRARMVALMLVALMLVALSGVLTAQQIRDEGLHATILSGIRLAGEQRYSEARAAFDRAVAKWPTHPAGYLNTAILLEVMSLDFETPVPHKEFHALLDRTRALAERLTERGSLTAEGNYYLGMAHSYTAYSLFRNGEDWLSGLNHGLKASSYLADCLSADPTAYDALTGIGTYKYWKSRRMSFLTWTPLVDDERQAGITALKRAEARAVYTGAQATNSLIWIYIEEERFADAVRAAQSVLRRFPNNRLFLWGLAAAAEKLGDLRMARSAYRRIVASLDSEVVERRYIEIQARAKIARLSYELGERDRARVECDWVLSRAGIDTRGFTPDGASRIEKRIDDMRELREELGK